MKLVVSILLGVVALCAGQINPPTPTACSEGACCSALWYRRQVNVFWQGPIHFFDTEQCREDAEEDDLLCKRPVGDDCRVDKNAADCQLQAECCWLGHWRNNQLTDDYDEDQSWGQYFCNQVNATAGPIQVLWELELEGRWTHCAEGVAGGLVWTRYPDIPENEEGVAVPRLCCRRNAVFDPNCEEDVTEAPMLE